MLDGTNIISETVTDAAYGNSYTLYYVYDANGSITGLHYNGSPYYFQKNIQGDVLRICNAGGAVVVEYTYDAWGNILSVTGSMASTLGQYNPFRYRGYYYDSETDLYYLNSRYYDSQVGRFINADAVMATVSTTLNGYNLFAYCFNNPINMVDSSGNWPEWIKNAVKWVASNIAKPVVDFVQDTISKIDVTYSSGCGISANDYANTWGYQCGISFDTKGNISVQITEITGGTTGTPGFSATGYRSISNAPSIDDLEGEARQYGVSGGIPIEYVPVSLGGDLIIMEDGFSDETYYGISVSEGFGVPGFEAHAEITNTSSVGFTRINVFDEFNKFYEAIMRW